MKTSLIPDTPPASTQEAYERIHAWFSQPNTEYGMQLDDAVCRYRANGEYGVTACAAGCLIPDTLYTEDIEGRGVIEFYDAESELIPVELIAFFQNVDQNFLESAQRYHNDSALASRPVSIFRTGLSTLARDFGLDVVSA